MHERSPWTLGRILRWLGVCALVVAIVTAAVLARLVSGWKGDIAREIAAIEASGAPARPEDISLAPSSGPAWWEAIDTIRDPLEDLGLYDPASLKALLARPDADLAPFGRPLLEDLDVLYDEALRKNVSADDVWFEWAQQPWPSGADGAPPEPSTLLLARVERAGTRALIAGAGAACRGARFDSRAWIEDWLAGNAPLPITPNFVGVLRIQKALARHAWLAAFDGDAPAALQALRVGFCAARAFEDTPGRIQAFVWGFQNESAILSLTRVARFLPDLDLSEFDSYLARLDPHARLIRALEEDRAINYRVFDSYKEGGSVVGDLDLPLRVRLFFELFITRDRRIYLESHASLLSAARGTREEARTLITAVDERVSGDLWAIHSLMLLPPVASMREQALYFEAQATLARAVLLGRREGTDAARAWIEAQVDPGSEGPYRTSTDGLGRLRMWSVGSDGVDDGGSEVRGDEEGGDIVVLLRAAAGAGSTGGK